MAMKAVGYAMWGGRRPEDVGEPRTIHAVESEQPEPTDVPEEPSVPIMALRSLLSLCFVVFGTILLAVGLGLILGVGGALVGAGLVTLIVGIMLGLGDDT